MTRFFVSSALGLAFFLLPVPVGDRLTVPFDLAVQWLVRSVPSLVGIYCLAMILAGGTRARRLSVLAAVRALAIPLALLYHFDLFFDDAVSA